MVALSRGSVKWTWCLCSCCKNFPIERYIRRWTTSKIKGHIELLGRGGESTGMHKRALGTYLIDAWGVRRLQEMLRQFIGELRSIGLSIVTITPDGNCFYRAAETQINGSPKNHSTLRQRVATHMMKNREAFNSWFSGSAREWKDYV